MKKVLSLLLALVMCLSFAACGEEGEKTGVVDSTGAGETLAAESATMAADDLYLSPEWLDKMVVEQGNRHNMNIFNYDNNWIYGCWPGTHKRGEVVKVRYDWTDWTALDTNTNGNFANCQAVKDGYLYYSRISAEGTELVKVRTSGEDGKVIVANHGGSIQLVDEFIYYTTPEVYTEDGSAVTSDSANLYRCDLNGENKEAILKTPVYYFTVFGNYVIYQDDKDGMTLHIYDMSSGENVRINEHRSFWPIYDGEFIYYLTDSESPEKYKHKLRYMSIDGEINEEIDVDCYLTGMLVRGDYIYYINADDSRRIYRCRKDGSEIELVSQDPNVGAMQWLNDALAYTTVNKDGSVYGFFFCNEDGTNKMPFKP